MKLFIADLVSCGVNYYFDYIIEGLGKQFKFTKKIKEADLILMLGGCCCTEVQIYNTLTLIKYILANKKPGAVTYLSGCITRSFKDNSLLQEMEQFLKNNIDYIFDHYRPDLLLQQINEQKNPELSQNYGLVRYSKNEAHLYIQNGCSHNCSFCKTNYLNCNLKDAPLDKIKKAIEQLNSKGVRKIELRGLNLSQYGLDLYKDYKLIELCEYIEAKTQFREVKLSGISFSDAIRADFAEQLKHLSKITHINGSLESGSNRILSLMNKGFTREQFLEFYSTITSVHKKQFLLNIISGFPTETMEDILQTIEVLSFVRPALVNINAYLDSTLVPSHNLEQLTESQIQEHTKVYSKALRKEKIKYRINGAN